LVGQGIIRSDEIPQEKRLQFIHEMNAEQASRFIKQGIILPDEIPQEKRLQLIVGMNAKQAFKLAAQGVICREDINENKRLELILEMGPGTAVVLAKNRIICKEEIPEGKYRELIQQMTVWEAFAGAQCGLYPADKCINFIHEMSAEQACSLVGQGFILPDEIPEDKRQQFIHEMNAEQASRLVCQGIIRSDEIPQEKRLQFIHEINAERASRFIRQGIILPDEIPQEKRLQFIHEMNAEQTSRFIRRGIILPDEIPQEKRLQFIHEMNAEQANWLVGQGIIRPDEIPEDKRQQFIHEMNAEQARWLVGQGIIRSDEIPQEKRLQFIHEMNAEQAVWLLRKNVLRLDEIPIEKRRTICDTTDVQLLFNLADTGLIQPSDLNEASKQRVVEEMNPDQAAWLIRNKFITVDGVPCENRKQLLENSSIGERLLLAEVGLIENENVLKIDDRQIELREDAPICFSKYEIQDEIKRAIIAPQLTGVLWELAVTHLNHDGSSGFAGHPCFTEHVFFIKSRLGLDQNVTVCKGDMLQTEITMHLNKKRQEWNFVVAHGTRIKQAEQEIPKWQNAWQFFAPSENGHNN
jgi:hypothetical protein